MTFAQTWVILCRKWHAHHVTCPLSIITLFYDIWATPGGRWQHDDWWCNLQPQISTRGWKWERRERGRGLRHSVIRFDRLAWVISPLGFERFQTELVCGLLQCSAHDCESWKEAKLQKNVVGGWVCMCACEPRAKICSDVFICLSQDVWITWFVFAMFAYTPIIPASPPCDPGNHSHFTLYTGSTTYNYNLKLSSAGSGIKYLQFTQSRLCRLKILLIWFQNREYPRKCVWYFYLNHGCIFSVHPWHYEPK